MPKYMLLMHTDVVKQTTLKQWDIYLSRLRAQGNFIGGSELGGGVTVKGKTASRKVSEEIGGYILVSAKNLAEARKLVKGNPGHLAGGTIEVRTLPKS